MPKQYIVDDIVAKRKHKGKIQYMIKWEGEDESESTWEYRTTLLEDGCKELITEYELSLKTPIKPIKKRGRSKAPTPEDKSTPKKATSNTPVKAKSAETKKTRGRSKTPAKSPKTPKTPITTPAKGAKSPAKSPAKAKSSPKKAEAPAKGAFGIDFSDVAAKLPTIKPMYLIILFSLIVTMAIISMGFLFMTGGDVGVCDEESTIKAICGVKNIKPMVLSLFDNAKNGISKLISKSD